MGNINPFSSDRFQQVNLANEVLKTDVSVVSSDIAGKGRNVSVNNGFGAPLQSVNGAEQETIAVGDNIALAETFINREYLNDLKQFDSVRIPESERRFDHMRFYQVDRIVYDAEEDPGEKLIGVYQSLGRFLQNVILIIKGTPQSAEIYFGVKSKQNSDLAGEVLNGTMEAYFPGSKLEKIDPSQNSEFLTSMTSAGGMFGNPTVAVMNIVPSLKENGKEQFTQGMEKFIDTMRGNSYVCAFIVSVLGTRETNERKRGLEELYSALYPYFKRTLSHSDAGGVTLTNGLTDTISSSITRGVALSTGSTKTSSSTVSSGTNVGISMLMGVNFGKNNGTAETSSVGTTDSRTESENKTQQQGTSKTSSESRTSTITEGTTIELQNKKVADLLEKLEQQIKRIDEGCSYGMWEGAAYFVADSVRTCAMAAGAYKSLVAGEMTGVEQYHVNYFSSAIDCRHAGNMLECLRYGVHPKFELATDSAGQANLIITPTSYLNGKELPLFLGLPRKSVNGVSVIEMAEFGRNIIRNSPPRGKELPLGQIYHMKNEKGNGPVNLDLESLSSHCFVTGSTGSGKSKTVYKILDGLLQEDVNVPFLVIEPAKGEYRREFSKVKNINVFTANPTTEQFLKLNPFYFNPRIHILEHLDRLIEIFNACWEMFAAMPAILKDALEKCYIKKGWDLTNSVFRGAVPEYPNFSDLLNELPLVIEKSGYSADTKGDYRGALVTRVSSLTNGIYGQIFCDIVDIDDETLFDGNTIIDLSRIGSAETKSLIMGFLVLRLSEYRMSTASQSDSRLRHVTVLEEAHNLLKNTSQGGSAGNTIIAKSVEMITNCIAEMRTYGEGFIIVDQSPTAVDIAAIKNTNTKIVMRLPEKGDCELCGRAISLSDAQIGEISKLETGVAAVMQNDWAEAVLCKVKMARHEISESDNTVDIGDLMRFKGKIVSEMLDRFIVKNDYDESKVIEEIERFDIHPVKKCEMKRYVSKLADALRKNPEKRKYRVSKGMMKLLGFEDSFFAAEPLIRLTSEQDYDESSIDKWRGKIDDSLLQYLDADRTQRNRIFQCLLYSMDQEQRIVDYRYLYNKLYVR